MRVSKKKELSAQINMTRDHDVGGGWVVYQKREIRSNEKIEIESEVQVHTYLYASGTSHGPEQHRRSY